MKTGMEVKTLLPIIWKLVW